MPATPAALLLAVFGAGALRHIALARTVMQRHGEPARAVRALAGTQPA
jgi:hypothetical protein